MAYNSVEEWRSAKDSKREKFMTKDEMVMVNEYISKLNNRVGDMGRLFANWDEIEEYYSNEQADIEGSPNTKVNIINSNVEGQVSQLVEQNIAVTTRGEGPSDEPFADWARIGLDWTLRKNKFKQVLAVHERRRTKFGVGLFNVSWDSNAIGKFGLAKIFPTPLNKLFVDGQIKDPLRFQEAEYICEVVTVSKTYMKNRYGKDKADAVDYGNNLYRDNGVFQSDDTQDDEYSVDLLLWWSRQDGKLRLQEISGCGVLLYDSHKEGGRKDNQKHSDEKIKSYYKYVNDRYPYFLTVMYPEEGNLYGFGDGKLLLPLQKMINELYNKIRISARPNLILIDTNAEVDLSDFDENSLEPRYYEGSSVQGVPVHKVEYGVVNTAWWSLLDRIHVEAQRVTRFSNLMIGQGKSADTATEASIQQQQGYLATDHKKLMLQETLVEVCQYCLALMMEHYTEAKAFRISEEKPDYEWIDFRKMTSVPALKPASASFKKEYKDNNSILRETPEWEIMQEGGKDMTKSVDFDIEINIGAGLPKNKTFLWQMLERLAAVQIIDETTGMPRNLIHYQEFRKLIKDFIGLPISEEDEAQPGLMQAPGGMQGLMQQNGMQGIANQAQAGMAPMQNAMSQGMGADGRPMMSNSGINGQGRGML
jgi:hypothetical protein